MAKRDEYGWDRVEKKKEPDPDLQYLKLRAKQARPARYALYALFADYACFFQQSLYCIGRLCAVCQPFVCCFCIYLQNNGFLCRIIDTDFFDRSAVSGCSGICYNDSIKRSFLLSHSS